MFVEMPPMRFVLSGLQFNFRENVWSFFIEFDAGHYNCYFEVNKASRGIQDVVLKRQGNLVCGADILIKPTADQHIVYTEVYNAFHYLLSEN